MSRIDISNRAAGTAGPFLLLALCLAACAAEPAADYGRVELPPALADPGTRVEPVKLGLGYTEGPAPDADGNLYFSEFGRPHRVWKVDHQGRASIFQTDSHGSIGMAIDRQGRLVKTERGRLVRVEKDGRETVLAKDYDDLTPETNDLTLGPDGELYFTNPVVGGLGRVFFLKADGRLKEVAGGLKHPNGIKWLPERSCLFLGLYADDKIVKFDVLPDGALRNPRLFLQIDRPDGIAMDNQDRFYIASHKRHAVQVFTYTGTYVGQILIHASSVSNCACGGAEDRVLYITGDGGVWQVRLKTAGRKLL